MGVATLPGPRPRGHLTGAIVALTSRNNLAAAYETAGRLGDAIALHEASLADRERVLGH